MSTLDNLLKQFDGNPGAPLEAIRDAATELAAELPSDYVAFLRHCNGGEGMIGENYVVLWYAEQLAEMNASYEATKRVPGLLLFGSDGGGEALAFDTRTNPWPIVQVPFVGMELKHAQFLAPSFDAFIGAVHR